METSRLLYAMLLAAVVLARLAELAVARRNTEALLAAGAVEVGRGHYPVMVVLHAAFLASCAVEVLVVGRPFERPLAALCAVALIAAAMLRWWAIHTLAGRWTTRVLWLPGTPRIAAGPYRFVSHPNYLAVVIEILALPLLHSAWVTALVFGLANAALLGWRIRVEELAIRRFSTGAPR